MSASNLNRADGEVIPLPATEGNGSGHDNLTSFEAEPAAEPIQFDVFSKLVESPDDFLGMLAYSLYKRHKIEWLRCHPDDGHDAFKKVACTVQQVDMYRNQAEQLAKNFIDLSLEQLGEEMRNSMLEGLLMSRLNEIQPAIGTKIDELKSGFWKTFGNHILGGIASAFVALTLFGVFSLYSSFQTEGGLEGIFKKLAAPQASAAPINQATHP